MVISKKLHLYIWLACSPLLLTAQTKEESKDSGFVTIAAGAEYKKGKFYQWLFGKNRRNEWVTTVRVPVINLDSMYGGLKPYKAGGGNETMSLRLRNAQGKEYTMRSINKSRADVIEDVFKNTFVGDIITDGVSMSHPYGAFAVAAMQQSASIPHSQPILVYIPKQPALDTFSERFGNHLYLLEQRPDEDWSDADNLGNFSDFESSEDLLEKMQKNNEHMPDQFAFAKARLFDMLIADWDRHEDNWRWGKQKEGEITHYIPVPRDRDQAFYTHNGIFIDKILVAADLAFMQDFDYRVRQIHWLNWQERHMDKYFTNQLDLDDWVRAAVSLQRALPDTIIEKSVKELPPEIFTISGKEMIAKLKARRDQLVGFATSYYLFLARQVEVAGSRKRETFTISEKPGGNLLLQVARFDKNGVVEPEPYYQRVFVPGETKEIDLYGIGGNDVFNIAAGSSPIRIRVIGGPDADTITQQGGKVYVYDRGENVINASSAKLRLGRDSTVHEYHYDKGHEYNLTWLSPIIFYGEDDRLFANLTYNFKTHNWRRTPYDTRQSIGARYSFTQKAFSALYSAKYPNLFGNWGLNINAGYDAVRWTNFHGLGNETLLSTNNVDYYRLSTEEWLGEIGVERRSKKFALEIAAFYQQVRIRPDSNRFVVKVFQPANGLTNVFAPNQYGGLRTTFTFASVNDSILPTRGYAFLANANLVREFREKDIFQKSTAEAQAFLPIGGKFSLAVKAGGTLVAGNRSVSQSGQIYEHALLGGTRVLRGYRYGRFWGKSAVYNSNELRFITDMRTHLVNGKVGLLCFFDNGRVWMPNEISNVWHTTYGGGIIFSPFHLFSASLTYGFTSEASMLQLRINTLF